MTEHVTYTFENIMASRSIPDSELMRLDVSRLPHYARGILVALTKDVLGWDGDGQNTVEVEYPADWWQHFKQRWFPESWKTRWPVQMSRRIFAAQAVFPAAKVKTNEITGKRVVYTIHEKHDD